MNGAFDNGIGDIAADIEPLRGTLLEVGRLGDQFAARLTSAFEAVAVRGKSLDEVVRGLGLSLSRIALDAAFKPIESVLGGALDGVFSGLFGGSAAALPVPFALGGAIARPAGLAVGMRNARSNDVGAETIVGSSAGMNGRSDSSRAVNITFNVQTPDVAGFRRAESQITALLARSVSRGQRDL